MKVVTGSPGIVPVASLIVDRTKRTLEIMCHSLCLFCMRSLVPGVFLAVFGEFTYRELLVLRQLGGLH